MLKSESKELRKHREVTTPVTLKEANVLFKWLQDEPIEGYTLTAQPNLTPEQAFCVLYMLQEEFGLIPNTYEMCSKCKELYDSDVEGVVIDENTEPYTTTDKNGKTKQIPWTEPEYGNYCDTCSPL